MQHNSPIGISPVSLIFAALIAALPLTAVAQAPSGISPKVGEAAPPVSPTEWLNATGTVTWASLKDRLVLVEQWATWCPPCKMSIPHLIQFHNEYLKKGLTIIGCTDEKPEVVKPFVEEMKMPYLIALGGFDGYKTPGIPHGWLVSGGKVVWEGNPLTDLKAEVIEEHLKGLAKPKAAAPPKISLPKELSAVQKSIDTGKYGAAVKELEKRLKGLKKKDDVSLAAKEALDKIMKYGDAKYAEAVALKKEKDYGPAAHILADMEKAFAGSDLGDKAKTRRAEWLKDKAIETEVKGFTELEKALDLVAKEKFKEAKGILKGLAEGKRYNGTKLAAAAKDELEKIKDKG